MIVGVSVICNKFQLHLASQVVFWASNVPLKSSNALTLSQHEDDHAARFLLLSTNGFLRFAFRFFSRLRNSFSASLFVKLSSLPLSRLSLRRVLKSLHKSSSKYWSLGLRFLACEKQILSTSFDWQLRVYQYLWIACMQNWIKRNWNIASSQKSMLLMRSITLHPRVSTRASFLQLTRCCNSFWYDWAFSTNKRHEKIVNFPHKHNKTKAKWRINKFLKISRHPSAVSGSKVWELFNVSNPNFLPCIW